MSPQWLDDDTDPTGGHLDLPSNALAREQFRCLFGDWRLVPPF
ncbi:hypothetical protein SAMN05661093_10549 [Kibdelosporangium aridum]|uniref:Uncharacterized protein n=1 Tax=Kibdelosporangium aridum TaxID=2030 RepID=A0A1W2FZ20_KIBAR|nr:hypothetical protein SAMN05661093_10549 [Kibdelosporangium aridum]